MTSDDSGATAPVAMLRTILLVAGFGDNRSMFEPLLQTPLARAFRLLPINLPGFGAPPLRGETTLARLASFLDDCARRENATIVVAHSVASIIASLAARRPGSPINAILSLEGNLIAEDAYFSGTAADYDDPDAFRSAFLARLLEMSKDQPIIARYRMAVASADPAALWELGRDVRRFGAASVPGAVLMQAPSVTYLYNPANLSASSLAWLGRSGMRRIPLANASHWKSVDQPVLLAEKVAEALAAA